MSKSAVMPFLNSTATAVELTNEKGETKQYWKKEILPSGTRTYKGQKLDFGKINPACVQAFDDGAFDSVPFVLTMPNNDHPDKGQEAEHLEGDLHKVEMGDKGQLFGYFDFTNSDKVPGIIQKSNGKFGVSGRIEVGYKAEDTGKEYPYALSHVCGTTRPHIKGMKPWEAVTLSDNVKGGMVLDFSADVLDDEIASSQPKDNDEGGIEVPGLDKETIDWLQKFVKDSQAAEEKIDSAKSGDDGGKEETTAKLSEADTKRIELAETNTKRALELAETAQREAASEKWKTLKSELTRAGVPPAILATEGLDGLMSSPKRATISLSDTESIDATEIVSKVLDSCKGIVPLDDETGSAVRLSESEGDDKEFAAWAREWGFPGFEPESSNNDSL